MANKHLIHTGAVCPFRATALRFFLPFFPANARIGNPDRLGYNIFIGEGRLKMDNILVTVIGIQRDAGGDENRIELVTPGRKYQKNGVHYITYKESAISGMEGSTTLIKLYPGHVTVIRMGSVEHKQEFCLGEETFSTYITPYGSLEMGIQTKLLEHSRPDELDSIQIGYDLKIDGQWQSYNELSISIREDKRYGY